MLKTHIVFIMRDRKLREPPLNKSLICFDLKRCLLIFRNWSLVALRIWIQISSKLSLIWNHETRTFPSSGCVLCVLQSHSGESRFKSTGIQQTKQSEILFNSLNFKSSVQNNTAEIQRFRCGFEKILQANFNFEQNVFQQSVTHLYWLRERLNDNLPTQG